ncbi:MAG: hypothetical protein IT578_04285 [Verrucomicrobiae bacterium]|nr:hypothetical protein [Verrucomicrobiae bacterium]
MRKRVLVIVALLALAVAAKGPWEDALRRSRGAHRLGAGEAISVKLRARLGQNLAVALLSGFRGIVADFVWLGAHSAWEDQKWYKMREGIELAVVLQPHSISFWDIGAWHFAWNASYGESVNPKYPSDAYRLKVQRDWILAGKTFLEQGILNNPDNWDLKFKLGWIYYQKLKDPLGSVPWFKKASAYPEAPLYVGRMVGHMYVKGERTREALEWWKKLWAEDHARHPEQLWHKIAQWGHEAEEKLAIPTSQRVFPAPKKSGKKPGFP